MKNILETMKAKSLAIIIIAILMTSATLFAFPVNAQSVITNVQSSGGVTSIPSGVTPDVTIQPNIFLSVSPTPIGVNQMLLVNVWMIPPLQATRYYSGYTVTVTMPNGTTATVKTDSYYGDATAWFPYVVDAVGTWTFTASYPGGYYASGNYTSNAVRSGAGTGMTNPQSSQNILWDIYPNSTYYKPATTPQVTNITVQQNAVSATPEPALPGAGQYWSRPVEPSSRYWWSILGDYPFTGPGGGTGYPADTNLYNAGYSFSPYVTAPLTAHIVWDQQYVIGGLVGPVANVGQIQNENWQTIPTSPSICYAGRCYQTVTKVFDGKSQSVWECYDLQTGQIYWDQTGITQPPTYLEYGKGAGDTPGATAIRFEDVNLVYIGSGRLIKYEANTGAVTLNMSIAPLTTGTYYMNGYALSIQTIGTGASTHYQLINWTTLDNTITTFVGAWVTTQTPNLAGTGSTLITSYTGRLVSNTSYARSSLPGLIDYQVGIGAVVTSNNNVGSLVTDTTTIGGYSLATGQSLWNTTIDDAVYSGSCNQADHGMIAIKFKSGYYRAWNLATGTLAWTSDQMAYPWDADGFGAYASQSGYGLLYDEAYSGVYAFNWTTGHIQWKFEAAAPDWETPYTGANGTQVYSWDSSGRLADGMLFTSTSEHSPSSPVTRGWSTYAINVTTGTEVWHTLGEMNVGPICDGYMVGANIYDGYTYTFGMGLSATTVTAPDVSVPLGTAFTIKGTVLDQSPAQPGTPCVSADSMNTEMNYLHMQMPLAGLWGNETINGVPVTLTAIDSKGAAINIGTTTTNGYYGTFGYTWTPPSAGQYTIIATFAGDWSYGNSGAATTVTVSAAAATPTPVQTQAPINAATPNDIMTYVVLAAVAIIIAIAIATVLILRKH
jgi:hypothetical protein